MRIRTIRHALAFVMIGIFLFIAAFSMTIGMQTDEHGNMSDCPFMLEQASVCSMGVFEHIAEWQQIFTVTFSQSNDFVFMVFLLLTFFLVIFARASNIICPALSFFSSIPKNKPETKLYNYLAIVFSRGILNSRLYA